MGAQRNSRSKKENETLRASELFYLVFDQLEFYAAMYLLFIAIYLVLYWKVFWGILDPMFYSIINLVGGAFCVWLLNYQGSLKPLYLNSFITTEIGLIVGFLLSMYLPVLKLSPSKSPFDDVSDAQIVSEFDVFAFLISCTYIVVEFISIATVGIIIFSQEENHASAFGDHGILRTFVASYRIIMTSVLFYKRIVLKRSWTVFEIVSLLVLLFGVLTSGSKSSILTFVFLYFIISYPLINAGKIQKIKVSLPFLIILMSFPIAVIMIKVGANPATAAQQVYLRLLASGDIFLLGYNDEIMAGLSESSFFKYAFYPGWGSILKNLGFAITPPRLIGSDIFEYYTNALEGGGPNARHNYLALHFFGLNGAPFYSLAIGLFIGFIRNTFRQINPYQVSYFSYLVAVIFAYQAPSLIDDINVFTNFIFWSLLFLVVSYVATKLIYVILLGWAYKQASNS
ncbi:hypothetical protein [Dyadobacter sp. CY326]|uniref:hypothetical protein n=1 Tax=Dyadobacter sp. CY326 TaxID=2907300 RepID=UPI001F3E0CA6|nr:hypothetical protein [Dyadobacter sp. CY326]MCE7065376.1 hypothetical protein [Dyadobacter sp. CY326]